MNMIHARVGLQRIQKFMQAEEMKGREALSLAPGSDPDNPFSAITVHPAGKGSTAAANGVTNASAVLAGVTKHAVELTPQTGKGQHHKENGTAAEQAQDADDVPLLAMSVDHPALAANGTGTTGDHSSVNGSAGPKQVHGQNGHITAVVTVAANGSEEEEEEEDEIAEEDVAVDMKDATFSWGGKGAPVIKDLCLRVAKGQLVMIVGEVGYWGWWEGGRLTD
jgi:ABC-type multidrug transport system fused ATPase/permease subunit